MDVVKDVNDKEKIGIGLEFRQDLLLNSQWLEKVCLDLSLIFDQMVE
jgi:hypothetical protein